MYFQSVLFWLKPVDFVLLFVAVNVSLWVIVTAAHSLPLLTLLALGLLLYYVVSFIFNSFFYIPWKQLLHPDHNPKNKALHIKLLEFSEITQYAVEWYYYVSNIYYTIQDFKKRQAPKFIAEISVVLLAIAYLGTLFSLHFLMWLLVDILLVLPGIIANDVLTKGYASLPSNVQQTMKQAKVQILGVLERFNLSPKVLFPEEARKKME